MRYGREHAKACRGPTEAWGQRVGASRSGVEAQRAERKAVRGVGADPQHDAATGKMAVTGMRRSMEPRWAGASSSSPTPPATGPHFPSQPATRPCGCAGPCWRRFAGDPQLGPEVERVRPCERALGAQHEHEAGSGQHDPKPTAELGRLPLTRRVGRCAPTRRRTWARCAPSRRSEKGPLTPVELPVASGAGRNGQTLGGGPLPRTGPAPRRRVARAWCRRLRSCGERGGWRVSGEADSRPSRHA